MFCLLLLRISVKMSKECKAAGILLYRLNKKTKIYEFLVGKSIKGYEALGGKKIDNESDKETAIREFMEETGFLLDNEWVNLFKKINFDYIKGTKKIYIEKGKYYLYIINISIFSNNLIYKLNCLPLKYLEKYNKITDYESGREMQTLEWKDMDCLNINQSLNRYFLNIIFRKYLEVIKKVIAQPIREHKFIYYGICQNKDLCCNPHCKFTHPTGHIIVKCIHCNSNIGINFYNVVINNQSQILKCTKCNNMNIFTKNCINL